MHRRAEYGVAAHWKYKEGKGSPQPVKGADDAGELIWVRQLLDWQRETADPSEFLDSLRFEINSNEVYAFTPRGDVISLPQDATPIDFAYAIHTEVGHKTIGARVNGRLVPLESSLANGDVVEIFTSKAENAAPSRDWLTFVRSPRARNKIRHYFTRERREESIETGKELLARQLRKGGLPLQRLLTLEHLTAVAGFFKLTDVSALYAAVGEGTVGPQAVVNRLIIVEGGDETVADEINEDRVFTGRRRRSSGGGASDCGIRVIGARSPGQAREVLYAGAWRRNYGLRDAWVGNLGAPSRLQQWGKPALGAGTPGSRRVGTQRQELIPGGYSD